MAGRLPRCGTGDLPVDQQYRQFGLRAREREPQPVLARQHWAHRQMIEQLDQAIIIEKFGRCGVRGSRGLAFGQERQSACHFTAEMLKQPEFIVGRDTKRAGDGSTLAFLGQNAAEERLTIPALEWLGLLGQRE